MKLRFCRLIVLLLLFSLSGQAFFAQERVFFGNLHSHTSYSDGLGKPKAAFKYARDIARVDFLMLSEHNHAEAVGTDRIGIATDPALYKGPDSQSLIPAAAAMTENGRFVALYGQEFSTISTGNHVNVFDIGEVINVPKGEFGQLIQFLQTNLDSSGQAAIIMFNHPESGAGIIPNEYGMDDFPAGVDSWLANMGRHARLIQMINGPGTNPAIDVRPASPAETAFKKFLNLGFKLAPTADQDNHKENWANATTARTAVVANALTKSDILGAIRARHVYATEDKNLRVIFKVNNRLMGDVISPLPAPSELSITYSIKDDDEPNAQYEVQVWRDAVGDQVAQMVSSVTRNGDGADTIEDVAFSGEPQFFYFKIIQRDEDGNQDRAWTAPIWFENQTTPPTGPTGPGIGPVEPADTAVASKRSEVFHVSDECLDAQKIKPANRVSGVQARAGRRQHENCPRRGPN
jgi:hypothetical protein